MTPTTRAALMEHITGSNRSIALGRVPPVRRDVDQIVPVVHRRCGETESYEHNDRQAEFAALSQHPGGAGRSKHQHILQPLLGPSGANQARDHCADRSAPHVAAGQPDVVRSD